MSRKFLALVVVVLWMSACSLRQPAETQPQSSPTTTVASARHCPNLLDRMRVGGLVGTVAGTIMTFGFGNPVLGVLFKVAGYAIGFTSADSCGMDETVGEESEEAQQEFPTEDRHLTQHARP